MKKASLVLIVVAIAAVGFVAGSWITWTSSLNW